MRQKQLGTTASLVIALMSLGLFAGAATVVTGNKLGSTTISFAKDGEEDGGSDSSDRDEDEDEDKDAEKAKKEEEKAKEKAKKEAEKSKKKTSSVSGSGKSLNETDDSDTDEVEDEAEDESGDDNGMFKDREKTLSKLQEEFEKVQKEILKKQAEGVDVSAALARLATAKSSMTSVNGAFDANDLEAAKDAAKAVKKLTHFAKEDIHDAKKIADEVGKVQKRISQVEKKLVILKALGGDTSVFETALAEARKDLDTAKALIAVGGNDLITGVSQLDPLEREVKGIKRQVEGAIFALGGEDDDLGLEHEDESEDLAEDLADVAEIQGGGIGKQVSAVARAQRLSAQKVSSFVKSIQERSAMMDLLVGPKEDDLKGVEAEIEANDDRIEILNGTIAAETDEDIKSMLKDEVDDLAGQNSTLKKFVESHKDKPSLFGWLVKLVS